MRIGTTSFGFRYQLIDPEHAPELARLVDQAAGLGLDVLQICENARPLDLADGQWDELLRHAAAAGVAIGLGCKTTRPEVFAAYLARAAALPDRRLRLVFEEESGTPRTRRQLDRFLAAVAPRLENVGVTLAIENHFDVPSAMLAEAACRYPPETIAFCVDTANSLRNFESPEAVMDLLGRRACCYHVKDFSVVGCLLGFTVGGAPLGKGRLNLDALLQRIFERDPEPDLFIENWTPDTGDLAADIRQDAAWLEESLSFLRARIEAVRSPAAADGRA
jgi:sugar phosphate isomerase/epimerase